MREACLDFPLGGEVFLDFPFFDVLSPSSSESLSSFFGGDLGLGGGCSSSLASVDSLSQTFSVTVKNIQDKTF